MYEGHSNRSSSSSPEGSLKKKSKHPLSSESSSCSSDGHSPAESRSRSRGKNKSRSQKSGLSKAATDKVKFPQAWPHLALNYEFGIATRKATFFDLDLRAFTAGELEIIQGVPAHSQEQAGRTDLLQKLLYLSGAYDWSIILNVYAAVVGRIERGLQNWGNDFSQIIQMVLAQESGRKGATKYKLNSKINSAEHFKIPGVTSASGSSSEWVYFCSKFQRNSCGETNDHAGTFRGKSVRYQHICAKCWQKDKIKRAHPESSSDCPNFRA